MPIFVVPRHSVTFAPALYTASENVTTTLAVVATPVFLAAGERKVILGATKSPVPVGAVNVEVPPLNVRAGLPAKAYSQYGSEDWRVSHSRAPDTSWCGMS